MARVDFPMRFAVSMRLVRMTMIVVVRIVRVLFAPSAPEHPGGNQHDDQPRCQLEVGFQAFGVYTLPQVHPAKPDSPHDQGVRDGCCDPKQHGLVNRSSYCDDERRHHRFGMPGLKAVQRTKQYGARNEQPRVRGALREEVGE